MIIPTHPAKILSRADLHFHPLSEEAASYDPDSLIAELRTADLDLVAITEHDRTDLVADLARRARAAGLRTELVSGCEVGTRDGHLLALFVDSAPQRDRSLLETIGEIHDLGGLAIAAHPLLPTCISLGKLLKALRHSDPRLRLDGIEVANPYAAAMPLQQLAARYLARRYGVAQIGGGDGHGGDPGEGWTLFEGHSPASLREAILQRRTSAACRSEPLYKLLRDGPRLLWRSWRGS